MKKATGEILSKIREVMKNPDQIKETIDAYLIPSRDAHQSEYLADADKRREFVSGFTGSFGEALITADKACLWTDGRYFLQATSEIDDNWTLMKEGEEKTPSKGEWLVKELKHEAKVGVDPMLVSLTIWKSLEKQLDGAGISLVPVHTNLVDVIWKERPERPDCEIMSLEFKYTGKKSETKVEECRKQMKDKDASMLVVTALDEIAYLLNVRGSDIEYNPLFFSYVVLTSKELFLFVDNGKITDEVQKHFTSEGIEVVMKPYEDIVNYLKEMEPNLQKVWISPESNYALNSVIPDAKRISEMSPISIMKAIKTPEEIKGMEHCHIRDGVAVCRFFAWLEKELQQNHKVNEVTAGDQLEEFRQDENDYQGPSFTTISSVGANAAIIHYTPKTETAKEINTHELYLCDSGGQYFDGTTDVTRTVHFGEPSEYERSCFTRVYKGQFALGNAIFPAKTKGNCLDTLARKPLWDVGLDYLHGTGHGIGSYLNVHEGPSSISYKENPNDPGLQEGMFLTNEPGYYEDGKFGIRLENVIEVIKAKTHYNFKGKTFLKFKTITLVPIQTKMLIPKLLTNKEVHYLNEYHKLVREVIGKELEKRGDTETLEWLNKETEPITPDL